MPDSRPVPLYGCRTVSRRATKNPPATVPEVVKRMHAIAAELPAGDGVGVFNQMYATVTEMVADQLKTGGVFHDDAFMADLDVRFAQLWFAAYDSGDHVPRAWAPLFEARSHPGVLPIQFALAGMNAHIEHDLPVAVVATCVARGRTPCSPGVRDDYEQINDLLASVEAGIRRSFENTLEKRIDDHLGPTAHLVSSWSIDVAREVAWVNARNLWELRRVPALFDAYESALAQTVGMASRLLLTSFA